MNNNNIDNLSNYILKYIINYLDEDIDKICLVMICKRLWMSRSELIRFNRRAHVNLKSFQQCYFNYDRSLKGRVLLNSMEKSFKSFKKIDWCSRTDLKTITKLKLTGLYGECELINEEIVNCSNLSKIVQIEWLELDMSDNDNTLVLSSKTVPPNLKSLSLLNYNGIINNLPTNITRLELTGDVNEIGCGVLPLSLRVLEMGIYKYQLKSGVLPPHLESLSIERYSYSFDTGVLPPSLTSLFIPRFSGIFKRLPDGLLNLSFGRYEYTIRKGDIPDSITYLSIERSHGIEYLPNNLETLQINQTPWIKTLVPSTLKHLIIGDVQDQELLSICSIESIETLSFNCPTEILALRPFLGLKKVNFKENYEMSYSIQIRQLSSTSSLVLMDKSSSSEYGGIVSINPVNPNNPCLK